MCGIVGYVGKHDALPLLLDGLRRLEYRGYDSAGVAVHENNSVTIRKCVGRLAHLEGALKSAPLHGQPGIGHTRWATHGEPSERNSHPHCDEASQIAVVHNGIIENYQDLREELTETGHTFLSDTDTEVIPHLIEQEKSNGAKTNEEALLAALKKARGAYALGVLFADEQDAIYAARSGSPLIIGLAKDGYFIASDVPAILNHIEQVIYLNDGEVAILKPDGVTVKNLSGEVIAHEPQTVDIAPEAAERAGFETFMLKEMHEQPRILRGLLSKHTDKDDHVSVPEIGFSNDYFQLLRRIMIVSCGTAYHAAMYGKFLLEHMTGLAVETDLGSEFRYRSPRIERDTLFIAVSQSGETADTLASLRLAREMRCKILSICNVPGSTLTRESDSILFTHAGPEIGVASTKAYTAQLMAFALLSIHIGRARGEISPEQEQSLISSLREVPDAIHYVLERANHIQSIADKHHDGPSALYLGRRFNYPTALEGALKNKEISYQHAEGYAAGEMKHGPIALINEYMPVICICTKTDDEVYEKMVSNIKEVEARHGRIIVIATDGDKQIASLAEDIIYVPPIREEFSPLVNVVALQLLAYYAAQARGTDIDKPRNLAKSVTVE